MSNLILPTLILALTFSPLAAMTMMTVLHSEGYALIP